MHLLLYFTIGDFIFFLELLFFYIISYFTWSKSSSRAIKTLQREKFATHTLILNITRIINVQMMQVEPGCLLFLVR